MRASHSKVLLTDAAASGRKNMDDEEELLHRWLVKTAAKCHEVNAPSRAAIMQKFPDAKVILMGTHETVSHAQKRAGWL